GCWRRVAWRWGSPRRTAPSVTSVLKAKWRKARFLPAFLSPRASNEARKRRRPRQRRGHARARGLLPRARGRGARRAVERRERDRAVVPAAEVGADARSEERRVGRGWSTR